jgi:nitrogenase molybdenum-iron protein alpha/beta subunit
MSNANNAYRLSEIESNQGIRFSHAGASPGHHCPMHTALSSVRGIKGVSSLVVGMPECSFYSRYVIEGLPGGQKELHYTYVLDSNEVVFGCRDGLIEALKEMQADGASAILVIMTCIPALIGEDIIEITETFSNENDTKAVCIDMAHYKRNGYEAGFFETYRALLDLCPKDDKKTNQVTILGSAVGEESNLLKQWIGDNSYEILEIDARFSLDYFSKVTHSRLNIVTHMNYLPLAKRLEKEYEIPYVLFTNAYRINEIQTCYEEVKTLLGLSDLPEFKHQIVAKEMEQSMKKILKDSRFVITTEIENVLPFTEYLSSLSSTPCYIHLNEYQIWMKEWKEKILACGVNPYVSFVVQKEVTHKALEMSGFLEENIPHFSIGSVPIKGVSILQTTRYLTPPLIGYERTLFILNMLKNAVKEEHHAVI